MGVHIARPIDGAAHVLVTALVVTLAIALALAPSASAFTFNEPTVRQVGPDTMIFDWSAQKCEEYDITDESVRAFRDDTGKVQLIATHFVNYRFIGNDFDSLTHPCTKIMSSNFNPDHSLYESGEFVASPWTPDGKTIYALVHEEYRGWDHQGGICHYSEETWEQKFQCWYNAITSAVSTNSGATYTQPPSPTQLVASIPYQYTKDGPNGYFFPSNIVRADDGYFYTMFRAEDKGAQQYGTCVMRTRDLSDVTSWRAWSGTGFTVKFRNPYLPGSFNPADHVCAPVDPASIGSLSESLTWNTYFRKWMLIGISVGNPGLGLPPGVYYSLSDDLIDWQDYDLLMEAELTWTDDCVPPDPIRDPGVIDPNSTSRNFETVGQTSHLYYTEFHYVNCVGSLNRDLRRIPIEFSNQQPGGPQAAITTSTRSAAVGEPVKLDASGSSDTDGGTVEKYEWDFDDDGRFDRDTGTNPVTSTSFPDPKQVTVRVRVSDDDGKYTDETEIVQVGEVSAPPAVCKRARGKRKRACKPRR
jgi:hypothetical protein